MMKRVVDYLVQTMAEIGIDTAFMITGGPAMYLNHAFGTSSKISYVCVHHEQTASMAAEAYARVTGRPGLVIVTNGPSSTNAVTGVFGQFVDSIPCIYLSGQVRNAVGNNSSTYRVRQRGEHEAPIISIVKSITKYAAYIETAESVTFHVERAIRAATSGRPGPVWLDIPLDVQVSRFIDVPSNIPPNPNVKQSFGNKSKNQIRNIVDALLLSERPLILVGNGIRCAKAEKLLNDFVTRWEIPVQTAINAHDLIDSKHPMHMGRPSSLGDRASNLILQNCDLLLVIGARLNVRNISYRPETIAPEAFKIMIDIDLRELMNHPIPFNIRLKSDALSALTELGAQLDHAHDAPLKRNEWLYWCREKWRRYPLQYQGRAQCHSGVDIYRFVNLLSRCIPENAIIVTGIGDAYVVSSQVFEVTHGQRFFTNSGSAPMGFDLPAIIGSFYAAPDRPLVCLTGDGSLQMNIQELQTIVHHKIPTKIFVLNNNGYMSIRRTQKTYFDGRYVGAGPESGVSFPDLTKVAQAYGIRYVSIHHEKDMLEIIQEILASDVAVISEVFLDLDQQGGLRVGSHRDSDGNMVSDYFHDLSPKLSPEALAAEMWSYTDKTGNG
jgi:acetolactate synthase-1/2/3 large subunit